MIKTLRITSVAAVLLAAVILASVLGFLQPAPLLHLNVGTGGDKQVDKILSGPSAVDRFKERGGKPVDGPGTTSPLVREATVLEGVINPRPEEVKLTGPRGPLPPKIVSQIKPAQSSAKFDLLGICYSSDAQTSLAYVRLPDGVYQWVGPGSEVGHLTIKEIHKDSIVCADGGRDVEIPVVAPPETANLLEASDASVTPEPSLPRPAMGAKTVGSPVKPPMTASPKAAPAAPVASAQISKEEQESLSQLGDRLKSAAGVGAVEGDAAKDKLISEYKSAQANPTETDKVENPSEPATAGTGASKTAASEESRRQFLRKLSKPRTSMK